MAAGLLRKYKGDKERVIECGGLSVQKRHTQKREGGDGGGYRLQSRIIAAGVINIKKRL